MSEVRDQEALTLLRKRDARGFDLAYARYASRIFGFLVRLSRSRPVAEDLFQHTFLKLAEVGPTLRADSDLRAWLFSVARNAFHSHARSRGVQARVELALLSGPGALSAGPDAGLALHALEQALSSLGREDRELLLLVAVEGLSHAEVASVLGVDQVTVRKRVSRARERLAQLLDAEARVVPESESSE
jgi:RNA polymerase sigma-70 factor (ECF subfamily)